MYPEDLDSPRQELSNGGLGIVVTLLVRRQIDFLCASRWLAIQLKVSWQSEQIWKITFLPVPPSDVLCLCDCRGRWRWGRWEHKLKLDCPSVRHWAYASIFSVGVRFQIRKTSKQARLASFCILSFLLVHMFFCHSMEGWVQNWFFTGSSYRTRITCVKLVRAYVRNFDNFSKIVVSY